jgi:hypothetical protein
MIRELKRRVIETIRFRTTWYARVYAQVIESMDRCEEASQ